MSSASVFPRTFSCPVQSCRKTCRNESARDEHIARKHSKSPDAPAACRRLDKRMQDRLQLGSIPRTQATEGIKEIVPTDKSKISKSGNLGAESMTNTPKTETTTASSWSPHCLREHAEKTKGLPSGQAKTPPAGEPVVESSARTRVKTVRWTPKTLEQFDQRFITKIFRKRQKQRQRKKSVPKTRSLDSCMILWKGPRKVRGPMRLVQTPVQ